MLGPDAPAQARPLAAEVDPALAEFRGRPFSHAHLFASKVARVSAIAPDNSACSCARYLKRVPPQTDDDLPHSEICEHPGLGANVHGRFAEAAEYKGVG